MFAAHTPPETLISPAGQEDPDLSILQDIAKDFPQDERTTVTRLLQHFTMKTVGTFHSSPAAEAATQSVYPRLAITHKFVAHGMMALAALHLSQSPEATDDERKAYTEIAAAQMNAGMIRYRVVVGEITAENAEALFAFSSAITVFTLFTTGSDIKATLQSFTENGRSDHDLVTATSTLVSEITAILHAIRGVLVILVPCWDVINEGGLHAAIDRSWWPPGIPASSKQLDDDQKLQQLEKMWSRPNRAYEYSFDTLRAALKGLRENFALISRLIYHSDVTNATGHAFDWTAIMNWPVQLPFDFLSLIDQRCIEAWVILAHYAMLFSKAKNVLWFEHFDKSLVTTAAIVIGEKNWNWIEWPASTVGVRLKDLKLPEPTG